MKHKYPLTETRKIRGLERKKRKQKNREEKKVIDTHYDQLKRMLKDSKVPFSAKRILLKDHANRLIKLHDKKQLPGNPEAGRKI